MDELQQIQNKIYEIRGQRVMLDSDLAALYGVETRVLNQAVKRNSKRFEGDDFMFRLTKDEATSVLSKSQIATLETPVNTGLLEDSSRSRSQIVTLNRGRGTNIKYLPYAFTELGVAMLSSVLKSETAIRVNREIMRAFVEFRHLASALPPSDPSADIAQLRKDFEELKLDIEDILHDQNDINEETRAQLDAISTALAELQNPSTPAAFPEIGYHAVQKQREESSQNYPPHLTEINNLFTFRTIPIALHRCMPTRHQRCRAFRLSHNLMKQTFNTLAALLLAGVALCACSRDDEEEETRTTPPITQQQQPQTTLQVGITGDNTPTEETNINFNIPADDSTVY